MTRVTVFPTHWIHSRAVRVAILIVGTLGRAACSLGASPKIPHTPSPLHVEIDRLLRADTLAPPSTLADDAEFLRRATLDLHGIIPSADDARAFLDDKSADKREQLIDRLLASPRYARHFATTFDVLWLERRTDKVVKFELWYEYLYDAFHNDKSYNQIVREVLAADETQPFGRALSKFYHNRGVEPNAVTRDIGRLFFGMDMQCNQCHDHPVIDDYKIGDYHGLMAFVNRTYLFNNKTTKVAELGEKAEGELAFTSVFTGESKDKVQPRLPRAAPLPAEPMFPKEQEYLPKASKDDKPLPQYSRRALLAARATDGSYELLDRNVVNRLWAQLIGRGLVHPVDLIHPDNPPAHSAVLDLLTRSFAAHGRSVKWIVREIMLTATYGRSCELPSPNRLRAATVTKRLAYCEGNLRKLEASVEKAESRANAAYMAHEKLEAAASKKPETVATEELAIAAAKRDAAITERRRVTTLRNAQKIGLYEAKNVVEYLELAKKGDHRASQKWEQLVQFWIERGDIASLRPLSPEAFADSLMKASGVVSASEQKARASLVSKLPPEMKSATEEERPEIEAMVLDKWTFEPLRKNAAKFADLYADAPGQDFAASLNQALFFGNGGLIEDWLKPSNENLTARLIKLEDPRQLADELYLTVLTRLPRATERRTVAAYLQDRADRDVAIQEMVWGLLASNEFRFNH
jgi:hypothetical protein